MCVCSGGGGGGGSRARAAQTDHIGQSKFGFFMWSGMGGGGGGGGGCSRTCVARTNLVNPCLAFFMVGGGGRELFWWGGGGGLKPVLLKPSCRSVQAWILFHVCVGGGWGGGGGGCRACAAQTDLHVDQSQAWLLLHQAQTSRTGGEQ